MPIGLLLDVQDELNELNDILNILPAIRHLHAVMAEIFTPPKSSRSVADALDRIGRWARTLTGSWLPRDAMATSDAADLIDLGAAPDLILTAIQCRLNRLAALIALLVKSTD